MSNRIITICREFGSGGRTIGKEVADKLGIPCYDRELIQKAAEESGFNEAYVKEAGEYTPGSWLSYALSNRSYGLTNEDRLFEIQEKIILDIAEKESCVIVGRCADYILKDKADLLSVFVHASVEFRSDRILRLYGKADKATEERIKEKDKRRASYYRFYTDMKWGHAENYDVCLDSGTLGIQKCVDTIVNLY